MSAIVVAIVGLIAVGFVVGLVLLSACAVAGTKALNAVHDGGMWLANRRHHRRSS